MQVVERIKFTAELNGGLYFAEGALEHLDVKLMTHPADVVVAT